MDLFDKDQTDYAVKRLRKQGINIVRLHGLEFLNDANGNSVDPSTTTVRLPRSPRAASRRMRFSWVMCRVPALQPPFRARPSDASALGSSVGGTRTVARTLPW